MRPQQPYRALRAVVGTAIIVTVVALWVWGHVQGQRLGTLWDVVLLALLIASGIAVFGRRTFVDALDEAEQIKGGDDGEN